MRMQINVERRLVKPMHKNQPRDSKFVAGFDRWLLLRSNFKIQELKKCDSKMMVTESGLTIED
jgi:hypothetical protein